MAAGAVPKDFDAVPTGFVAEETPPVGFGFTEREDAEPLGLGPPLWEPPVGYGTPVGFLRAVLVLVPVVRGTDDARVVGLGVSG